MLTCFWGPLYQVRLVGAFSYRWCWVAQGSHAKVAASGHICISIMICIYTHISYICVYICMYIHVYFWGAGRSEYVAGCKRGLEVLARLSDASKEAQERAHVSAAYGRKRRTSISTLYTIYCIYYILHIIYCILHVSGPL